MRLQRGEAAHQPKGDFLFLTDDPADLTFICIRECAGRGKGLPEVEKITLAEARGVSKYKDLIESLRNQAYKILKFLT